MCQQHGLRPLQVGVAREIVVSNLVCPRCKHLGEIEDLRRHIVQTAPQM